MLRVRFGENQSDNHYVPHGPATGFFTGIVPASGSHEGVLAFFADQFATLAELETKNPPVAFVLTGSSPQTNLILTSDVWQCVNTLATGGDAQKNVGKGSLRRSIAVWSRFSLTQSRIRRV